MRKKFFIILFLIILSAVYGRTADSAPNRIISFAPAVSEELYLLGEEKNLIGISTYCTRPEQIKTKEKLGTVMKMDIEKVISLHPNIVITTPLMDKQQIQKLKAEGISVISFPKQKNFIDVCRQFQRLGILTGKKKEADAIVSTAVKQVEKIKKSVRNLPKVYAFIEIGARPLFSSGKNSFINDYINKAGGINIAANSKTGIYSRENVLKQNPDVIIIVSMDTNALREKRIWQKFSILKAVKNKRIYIIDAYKTCSPTPVSFAKALKEIAELLHPEIMSKVL